MKMQRKLGVKQKSWSLYRGFVRAEAMYVHHIGQALEANSHRCYVGRVDRIEANLHHRGVIRERPRANCLDKRFSFAEQLPNIFE